ncbi:MAG: hypothetical protein JNL63_00230 [Bacteroidia bacterium]|nr:hypothetical protein [Bacteroidia bacterium]
MKDGKGKESIQKNKLINRILTHSQLFSEDELKRKSVDQLKQLQKKTLITAVIKIKFQNRKNKKQ